MFDILRCLRRNTTKNSNSLLAKDYRPNASEYKTIKAYVPEFIKYQYALNDIEFKSDRLSVR